MRRTDYTELKRNISKNLVKYRTASGLTQSMLAEKINYSDKSVSKWERGEGMPDIFVLYSLAELYGVKIDSFFACGSDEAPDMKNYSIHKRRRLLIDLLSVGLVWLVATTVYFLMNLIFDYTHIEFRYSWIVFVLFIPVSGIVQTVFSKVWWGRLSVLISSSVIIWGSVLSAFCCFRIFSPAVQSSHNIFFVAIVLELLDVLWFFLKKMKRNSDS